MWFSLISPFAEANFLLSHKGYGATKQIRALEAQRSKAMNDDCSAVGLQAPGVITSRSRIFAVTGLAAAEDKSRAYGAGVDG